MKEGSMLDVALKVLIEAQKPVSFTDLWEKVKEELEITPEEEPSRIGHFYTDLSLNGRFVVLTGNIWDLRERHTYDKVHIDVNDVYTEVEESDEDKEDKEENAAYNAAMEGKAISDDGDESEDEDDSKKEDGAEILGMKKEDLAY